jgi:hypothetical protein
VPGTGGDAPLVRRPRAGRSRRSPASDPRFPAARAGGGGSYVQRDWSVNRGIALRAPGALEPGGRPRAPQSAPRSGHALRAQGLAFRAREQKPTQRNVWGRSIPSLVARRSGRATRPYPNRRGRGAEDLRSASSRPRRRPWRRERSARCAAPKTALLLLLPIGMAHWDREEAVQGLCWATATGNFILARTGAVRPPPGPQTARGAAPTPRLRRVEGPSSFHPRSPLQDHAPPGRCRAHAAVPVRERVFSMRRRQFEIRYGSARQGGCANGLHPTASAEGWPPAADGGGSQRHGTRTDKGQICPPTRGQGASR